jgi:hypothetical protein
MWWTSPQNDQAFVTIGFRGQFIYVNQQERVVIVLTNVWHNGADPGLHRDTVKLFQAFVTALRD